MEKINEIAFQIILSGGNGRSNSMEAIQYAKNGEFEKADELITEANTKLGKAHNHQTELLQLESKGEGISVNVILVHSQDHLMNAILMKDMANSIIKLN